MSGGAQLSVTDLRRAARHPVDFPVIGEHRKLGDLQMHIVNVSAHGFMTDSASELGRGDRVTIRLPIIGRIEAHLIWASGERTGFQFERILRVEDFLALLDQLHPNMRLRKQR